MVTYCRYVKPKLKDVREEMGLIDSAYGDALSKDGSQ